MIWDMEIVAPGNAAVGVLRRDCCCEVCARYGKYGRSHGFREEQLEGSICRKLPVAASLLSS